MLLFLLRLAPATRRLVRCLLVLVGVLLLTAILTLLACQF